MDKRTKLDLDKPAGEIADEMARFSADPRDKSAYVEGLLDLMEKLELEDLDFYLNRPLREVRQDFLKGLLGRDYGLMFLIENYGFVERNFCSLFAEFEGQGCSADKSRTVSRSLFAHLLQGKPIEFDYGAQYVYHLPKTIFKDQQSIVEFFEALQGLFYGKPAKYLDAISELHRRHPMQSAQAAAAENFALSKKPRI